MEQKEINKIAQKLTQENKEERSFERGKINGRLELLEQLIINNTNIKLRPNLMMSEDSFD